MEHLVPKAVAGTEQQQVLFGQLIGGDGAFVMVARDYTDIARAMSLKLEREIRSMPVTNLFEPDNATVRVAGNG